MKILDITSSIAKHNILTGRSALAYRKFGCSSDPRVITTIYNGDQDIYFEPRWLIPKETFFESEFYNGIEIATINQAIYHSIIYCYDDSYIDDLIDILSKKEFSSFLDWLKKYNIKNKKIDDFINIYKHGGDYKMVVTSNIASITIDNEFKPVDDIEINIEGLKESLREKIESVMQDSAMQFKNVVDVIICIKYNYPNGITKKELNYICNSINLHLIDLNLLLELSNKYMSTSLNGILIQEYAIAWDTLFNGLLDDNIDISSILKDGKWYYPL